MGDLNETVRSASEPQYNGERMDEFEREAKAVMCSVRALTEGIDSPSVDMAAFMSPKDSEIDIMQAACRAMRKDANNPKKVAHILVPVFEFDDVGETQLEGCERDVARKRPSTVESGRDADNSVASSTPCPRSSILGYFIKQSNRYFIIKQCL